MSLRPDVGRQEQRLNVIWPYQPSPEAELEDMGRLLPPSLLRKLGLGRVRWAGLNSPTGRSLPTPGLSPTKQKDRSQPLSI